MKAAIFTSFLLIQSLYSQVCLIDGKSMYPVGSSEIVKDELLSLFCCDDGHQMWLKDFDNQNDRLEIKKKIIQNPSFSKSAISLLNEKTEKFNNTYIAKNIEPVIKKETVLKKTLNNNNYSNSLNIQKFGVETLLHKKIESDRIFAEELENEKLELLSLMLNQKKLFERKKKNKLSFSKFHLFEKPTSKIIAIATILAIYSKI